MNPIALGLIALGMAFLLFGISNLMKRKRTNGMVFSLLGLIAIAIPFIVSFFLAR